MKQSGTAWDDQISRLWQFNLLKTRDFFHDHRMFAERAFYGCASSDENAVHAKQRTKETDYEERKQVH